jgi:rod shape-determining protein MreC
VSKVPLNSSVQAPLRRLWVDPLNSLHSHRPRAPVFPGRSIFHYKSLSFECIFGTVEYLFNMNNSLKSQRKKIIITISILSFLSLLIVFYKNSPPVLFFEGIVQSVFSAPKSILYALGKKDMDKRVIELTKKNQELEAKMVDYQLLKQDNEALKSQFVTSGETTQSLVAAKIIGFQGNGKIPSQFIINTGKKNGIKEGMTVIYGKYIVGKIVTVGQNYSVVITPFNEKFKVLAKLPETNANGIVLGRNDLMLFDGVVITDTLKKDGIIVTKGEVDSKGIGVVPDLIIGKITSISKNETSPFQSAEVMPVIEYPKLIDVFVISQM